MKGFGTNIWTAVCAPLFLLILLAVNTAEAAKPFTAEKISLGAEAGYGFYLGQDEANLYGFGLGVRGGYTLPMGLYLGARFDYFFGEWMDERKEENRSIFDLQAEAGYDWGLTSFLVLRPKLAFGPAQERQEVCSGELCGHVRTAGLSLAAGAEMPIGLGVFTISPEARFIFWIGERDGAGLHTGLVIGATF